MSKLFVNTIAPNSGDTVTVSGSLTTTGKLTIGDQASDTVAITAEVSSSIIPDDNNKYNLGSSAKQWKDLFIDGIANIDSASFDEIASPLIPNVGGTHALGTMAKSWGSLHVHGLGHIHTASINHVSSSLIPDGNNVYDLGSNTSKWRNLFIEGVITASTTVNSPNADFDNLSGSFARIESFSVYRVDSDLLPRSAGTGLLDIGSSDLPFKNLHIGRKGHFGTASIDFVSSSLLPDATETYDLGTMAKAWRNLHVHGLGHILTASLGYVTSSLLPGTDDVFDIGSDSKQWKDLYIDGTANIDTLSAQSASIDNINIDGNTISSTGGTDLNIIPKAGQQIVLDENIIIDSGSITGVHSLVAANVSPSNLTGSQFDIDGFNIKTKIETVSIGTASLDHVVLTTRTIGASVDSDTYTAHGSKVEVRSQLQAQLDDGTFAAFRLHNNSIAAESIVMGAFTGGTAGAITASFISANTIGANTASFRIHNETGGNIANDTGFTASFVVL